MPTKKLARPTATTAFPIASALSAVLDTKGVLRLEKPGRVPKVFELVVSPTVTELRQLLPGKPKPKIVKKQKLSAFAGSVWALRHAKRLLTEGFEAPSVRIDPDVLARWRAIVSRTGRGAGWDLASERLLLAELGA